MIARALYWLLSLVMPGDRFRRLIAATGIVVWVGPNGSGKSFGAVAAKLDVLAGVAWVCEDTAHAHLRDFAVHREDCDDCRGWLPRHGNPEFGLCATGRWMWDAGRGGHRLVYSTVPLLGPDGVEHDRYRPLLDYRQLLTIEHADVLFDEVAGVSDAHDSASIPVQVVNWLHQLRKRDVRLHVTTPAFRRCSLPIRQVAQVVVDARAFFPERAGEGRLWRPRRMFVFRAFDATSFDDFTAGRREKMRPLASCAVWRPGHAAESAYDTLAAVGTLGHVTDHGMCVVCGGSRSRPRCACSELPDGLTLDDVHVVETVTPAGARTRRFEVLDGKV